MTLRALFAASLLAAIVVPECVVAQNNPARAGDRVLLRIVRDSVYTDTLRIDPRGFVVIPMAGDVRIEGIAGDAIQDTIRARLARFIAPTAIEATLLRRVRVVGAVARPGVYYLDRSLSLRDALATAGGAVETGQERRMTLDRDGTRRVVTDWLTGIEGSWPVESGDQLVVDRLPWYQRNALALVTAVGIITSIVISISR